MERINDLIHSKLAKITQKAAQLAELQAIWVKIAGELSQHAQVVNIEDDVLIIGVKSAAWATQLRFDQKQLLENMHRCSRTPLRELRTKVLP